MIKSALSIYSLPSVLGRLATSTTNNKYLSKLTSQDEASLKEMFTTLCRVYKNKGKKERKYFFKRLFEMNEQSLKSLEMISQENGIFIFNQFT